ncbi:NAD(P)H-binding protein [Vibrio sp. WJH972]
MSVITVIGAGWLGLPLAKQLAINHTVYASKTNALGLTCFDQTDIHGFVTDVSLTTCDLLSQLNQQRSNIVIGCFPPGLRKGLGEQYSQNWHTVVDACKQASIDKLIMISTTGVYPDLANEMVETDATLSLAQTNLEFSLKSRMLLEAEELVEQSNLNTVIIRCGGLFGPNRHPSRFVRHLKKVSQKAPANMLHLSDAINIIEFSIEQINNEVINAVSPQKPSKAEFYKAASKQMGIELSFPPIVDIEDKRICVDKLLRYGFKFNYLSPIDAIPFC